MITVILSTIAWFMAQKGKRSVVMMSVYMVVLIMVYLIVIIGAITRGSNDRFIYYAIGLVLQLLLCVITMYDTDRIVEKMKKQKILLPIIGNFKLQEVRINNMLSPEQVASIIGINKKQYTKYELGQDDIPVSVIIQLAKLYKVSTDYLLGIELQDVQKTAAGSEKKN